MYRNYVIKRVVYGLLMYILMIFTYSVLFNGVTEQTMLSQIQEQVGQEMAAQKNLSPEQLTRLSAEKIRIKITQYHLDRPLVERIVWRALDTLSFNFGNATIMKTASEERSVLAIIGEAFPRTMLLFTTQVLLVLLIGVALGIKMAQKPGRLLDRSVSMFTMITNGLPSWWLGMILIMALSYGLKLFPSGGMHNVPAPEGFLNIIDLLAHLALPLLTLVVLGIWGVAYQTRNIVLGNLQEDYIMAARARGLPERRVLYGHTLRTAMPAIMTIAVLGLFSSISGNIVVEGIFSWPGLGNLYFVAVQQNDVPVLMGSLAITTLFNMCGFIILDIIYGWLDPRIRTGGKA